MWGRRSRHNNRLDCSLGRLAARPMGAGASSPDRPMPGRYEILSHDLYQAALIFTLTKSERHLVSY
jgi:hypothetical protein